MAPMTQMTPEMAAERRIRRYRRYFGSSVASASSVANARQRHQWQ
jgi:hypothetical protein